MEEGRGRAERWGGREGGHRDRDRDLVVRESGGVIPWESVLVRLRGVRDNCSRQLSEVAVLRGPIGGHVGGYGAGLRLLYNLWIHIP